MSREILFRGKRTDNDEWIKGYLHKTDGVGKGYRAFAIQVQDIDTYMCRPHSHEVQPETVGQFTGLTDKNDKKIFEGDIVKDLSGSMDGIPRVVFWNEEWMEFECYLVKNHWVYGTSCCRLWLIKDKELEVIGNKWDNPELMEKTK